MSTSQSVRFREKIVRIQTIVLNGVPYLRLKDVQRQFPSAVAFAIDNIQLSFLTDDNGSDLEPLRIIAQPDQVLDIVEPFNRQSLTTQVKAEIKDMNNKIDLILVNTQETLIRLKQLMTQLYEIHEYTTPRYFFILPVEQYSGTLLENIQDFFLLHFKLYFLCECSDKASELHIAPHRGYSIRRPKDFIRQYESYLRTTFIITRGILATAGVCIPDVRDFSTHFSHAIVPQIQKFDEKYIKNSLNLVATLLNTNKSGLAMADLQNARMQDVQFRELESYLETTDNKHSLGNLYRVVTHDGHVRWVCHEHYDSISFNRKMTEFIELIKSFGMFYDQERKAVFIRDIQLTTKILDAFRDILTKGFNILSLTIEQCSMNDNDLNKLLDCIINRSSIHHLTIIKSTIKVSKWWGMSEEKYICEYISIRIQNQLLDIQVSRFDMSKGDMKMLTEIIMQNKVCRVLNLFGNDFQGYEQDFRQCLQSNQQLTSLIISHVNNIEYLCEIFSKTTSINYLKLSFWSCLPSVRTRFCQILENNSSLIEFHLMNHHCFDDEDFFVQLLTILRGHVSIKHVTLYVCQMKSSDRKETALIDALTHHSFINCLHISESVISEEFIQAIIDASENNSSLIELNFYNCQIDEYDISRLHLLVKNHRLSKLNFSSEQYWSIVAEEIHRNHETIPYENTKLIEFIRENASRYDVQLDNRSLTDQDMKIITQEAIINKQCKRLRLASNQLTSIGIMILSDALKSDHTLYGLYLDKNYVCDEGVYFLVKRILYKNTTLKKLGLSHNRITDEGLKHLAYLMKNNDTITNLYLSGNQFTDDGIELLMKSIETSNKTLEQLDLSKQKFLSDRSIQSIIAMILHHPTLFELKIYECNLTESGKERLKVLEKMKKNFKVYVNNYLN